MKEKQKKEKSICCGAEKKVWSSDEGTCHYICSECEQPFVSKVCHIGNERTHNWKIDTTKDKDYEYCLKCGIIKPEINL